MSEVSQYKFQEGDIVLCRRPGLKKRVLEVIIPEFPRERSLVVRGDTPVELIRHDEMHLIQSAREREGLPAVSEAFAKSKTQWGDEIPPYMRGVPFANNYIFTFSEPIDERDS